MLLSPRSPRAVEPRLDYDPALGLKLRTDSASIILDRDECTPAPLIRFWPNRSARSLQSPDDATTLTANRLRLVYRAEAPGHIPFRIIREIDARAEDSGVTVLTEQLTLSATQPIRNVDVEIERPFMIASDVPVTSACELSLIRPRVAGWAEVTTIGQAALAGEYRFGPAWPRAARGETTATRPALPGGEAGDPPGAAREPAPLPASLALPLVQVGGPGWRCAVMAGPDSGALFTVRMGGSGVSGSVRSLFPGRRVALTSATHSFAFRLATGNAPRRPFDGALAAFARLMLADAPPAPEWLRQIALVETFDLGAGAAALERDLRRLAEWLTPAERAQVALVLGGWYNAVFPYSYDRERDGFEKAWLAPGDRSRWLGPAELARALRLARGLGFRVLLTFSEGLAADASTPYFPAAWALRDERGAMVPAAPAGLPPSGPLVLLNPADPRVADWFLAYADALLQAFGKDIDGFVMNRTDQLERGTVAPGTAPAWADRALFNLVQALNERVKAYNPQAAFLAGDDLRPGRASVPCALAADGTLNAAGADPVAAAAGLFASAHGVLWDSSPQAMTLFPQSARTAQAFGVPLIVNSDARGEGGPASWSSWQRDRIMDAFHPLRQRLARGNRNLYLTRDPATILPSVTGLVSSDTTVTTASLPGINWAADRQTTVSVSSAQPGFPATAAARGEGQGWASDPARPLPAWLALDFGDSRILDRFVVATVHDANSTTATAANLGPTAYEIQAFDEARDLWRPVVTLDEDLALPVRVHTLKAPVTTRRLRLLVTDVAPLDAVARITSFQAWGAASKEALTVVTQDDTTSAVRNKSY